MAGTEVRPADSHDRADDTAADRGRGEGALDPGRGAGAGGLADQHDAGRAAGGGVDGDLPGRPGAAPPRPPVTRRPWHYADCGFEVVPRESDHGVGGPAIILEDDRPGERCER